MSKLDFLKIHQDVLFSRPTNYVFLKVPSYGVFYKFTNKFAVTYNFCPYTSNVMVDLDSTDIIKYMFHDDDYNGLKQCSKFKLNEEREWEFIETFKAQIEPDNIECGENELLIDQYFEEIETEFTQTYFNGSRFDIYESGTIFKESKKIYTRYDFSKNCLDYSTQSKSITLKPGELWLVDDGASHLHLRYNDKKSIAEFEGLYVIDNSLKTLEEICKLTQVSYRELTDEEYAEVKERDGTDITTPEMNERYKVKTPTMLVKIHPNDTWELVRF